MDLQSLSGLYLNRWPNVASLVILISSSFAELLVFLCYRPLCLEILSASESCFFLDCLVPRFVVVKMSFAASLLAAVHPERLVVRELLHKSVLSIHVRYLCQDFVESLDCSALDRVAI